MHDESIGRKNFGVVKNFAVLAKAFCPLIYHLYMARLLKTPFVRLGESHVQLYLISS